MHHPKPVGITSREPCGAKRTDETEPVAGLFSMLFARALCELLEVDSEATTVQVEDFTPSDILETLGELVESLSQGDALDTRKGLALEVAREAIRWMEGW